jgi:hypothetical protein
MPDTVQPPPRELIVLSPYRIPGQNALYLGNDDMGSLLNACTALWHPAAVRGAASPPRLASPYDHEQPTAGHVYAVPESPPLVLPDDWDQRVRNVGAIAFRAGSDRDATLANLRSALRPHAEGDPLLDLGNDQAAPFFGVGFGYRMIEALYEAMEHENLIATAEIWQEVQAAVAALATDPDAVRRHLKAAADRLQTAREVLYPVTIHLLDLCLLDEGRLAEPFPASFDEGIPLNLVAAGALLERLDHEYPDRLAALRERVAADLVEVCGGPYVEREDALLPVQSQLWNLLKGLAVSRDLLQREVRVFARKRFGAHPQLPLLLSSVGLSKALLLAFDESVLPAHRATVINWPSPDGKQVEAFTRTPYAADGPQTFFHAAHYLHRTIMQDHAATLALLHNGRPAAPWYHDWLELSRLAPVLGQWTTLSRYLGDVLAGEYTSAASADEFHGDYLNEAVNAHSTQPVTGFARHVRWRRRLDTAWTLTALHRALAGRNDPQRVEERLSRLEDLVETAGPMRLSEGAEFAEELTKVEQEVAGTLAQRLVARATAETPGYLVLNPCGFKRRVALELADVTGPLPVGDVVKTCQTDGATTRLVVEVPALGFAWFPRSGSPGTPQPPARMRMADDRCVRNEYFEAEVDPTTGGLRGIRDHRTRISRVGQQLVFNPSSSVRMKSSKTTSTGPALGEIITEGVLLDEQQKVLASFRQRFRAWLHRPLLEMRLEIQPEHLPGGYPWHAYYGARFAWRDERALLLRGVNGTGYVTTHTRPETPDYLELRAGGQSTALFPGGLPFHQRHGGRMLDVILLPEGEDARTFDLAIGLDRDYPAQTALGLVTPVTLVPTSKGPPHVGASGWLFHLDAPNLALLGMRPASDGADGVVARLLECAGHHANAELRCVRNPQRALVLDARGQHLLDARANGDVVGFEVSPGDLVQVRVDFS